MKTGYQRRIFIGFCIAFLLLTGVGAAVYSSFIQMNHQKDRVEHTYKVLATLQDVLSDLKDIQSSVRGYVITGMQNYLTPYFVSVPKIAEDLDRLTKLVADNPEQSKRLDVLKEHVEDRLTIAEEVVETFKEKG